MTPTPTPSPLEARLRDALHARAAATAAVEPPASFTPPSVSTPTPTPIGRARGAVPIAVTVGLAAAAVITVVVVTRPEPAPEEQVVSDEVPSLLGPLPPVLLDLPGSRVGQVEVNTIPGPVTSGNYVQYFDTDQAPFGPRVQLQSSPPFDRPPETEVPDAVVIEPDPEAETFTIGEPMTPPSPITIQGEAATISSNDDRTVISWPRGDDGSVTLVGWDVEPDDLVAMANGLEPRGGGTLAWDATVVPPGLDVGPEGLEGSDGGTPSWRSHLVYYDADYQGPQLSFFSGGDLVWAQYTDPVFAPEPVTVLGDPGVLTTMPAPPGVELQQVVWRAADDVIGTLQITDGSDVDETIAALREVDVDDWVAAMPDDTYTPPEQDALIDLIGPGTPLPAGHDWSTFTSHDLDGWVGDSIVSGGGMYPGLPGGWAVCLWERAWVEAMDAGDQAAADAARAQLEGNPSWAVVEHLVGQYATEQGVTIDPNAVLFWARELIAAGDVETLRTRLQSSCPTA